MKKLLMTMLTVLACGAVYALPVGNPADPLLLTNGIFWDSCWDDDYYDPCDPCGFEWDMSLRIGYYGDFVFDRKMELDGFGDGNIERFELYTNAGLVVLNFWERLDIYATFGSTNFDIHTRSGLFGLPDVLGSFTRIETDGAFSWSVGARAVLWNWGCTTLGLDARYFRARPDIKSIVYQGAITANPDDLELHYHEWQVDLGLSHRINMLVPYIAVKWSKADVDIDGNLVIPILEATFLGRDLENRRQWGYAIGVSLIDCDIMSLNVEGRFRDESAVAVNAQIRF